jgi:hypothetical protein
MLRKSILAVIVAMVLTIAAGSQSAGQMFTTSATATAYAPAPQPPENFATQTNTGTASASANASASGLCCDEGMGNSTATTSTWQGYIGMSGTSTMTAAYASTYNSATYTDTLTVVSGSLPTGTPVNLVVTQVYTGTQYIDITADYLSDDVTFNTQVNYSGSVTDTAAGGQSIALSYAPAEAGGSMFLPTGTSEIINQPINQTIVQTLPTAVGDTVTLNISATANGDAAEGFTGHDDGYTTVTAQDQILLSTDNAQISFVSASGASYTVPAPAAAPLFGAGLSAVMIRLRRRVRPAVAR